jgi:hypothetical protein
MGSNNAAICPTPMRRILFTVLMLSVLVQETRAYADELVTTEAPPRFSLKNVVQDVGTQQIVAKFVVSGGNNVVPIMYMPRVDSPAAYLDRDTNPCAVSERDKLCCLKTMRGMYDMDVSWVGRLEGAVMTACNTTDIPYSTNNTEVFGGGTFPGVLTDSSVLWGGGVEAIPGVEYSYENVLSDDGINNEDVITLRMATTYIVPRSKVTDLTLGTYKYEFFVGMVFATLKEQDVNIITTVIQQHIEFTKSDFGFFAVGTEQDRSVIKQVSTFIYGAKNPPTEVDGVIDPATGGELYQYLEVNVIHDPMYTQGTKSVKVMLDTLKFAQETSIPSSPAEWTFPCSPALTSFYGEHSDDWNNLFAKQCLPDNPTFCVENFSNGRFWVPFDTSTATTSSGYVHGINRGVTLFFAFEIMFSDSSDNSEMMETVYGTINVNNFPVLEHCNDAVVIYDDITDTVSVEVMMGTGTPPVDSTNTMDLTLRGSNGKVNKMKATAASYGAAVISLVVDGLAFSDQYSTKFQVDNLMIFNFLGASNAGFENVMSQILNGGGVTVERLGADDHFSITPAFGAGLGCEEAAAVNSGISCLWRRAVIADVVTDLSTESIYYLSSATPTPESEAWVKSSFFPDDDTPDNAVKFLKEHCPKAYATTDVNGDPVAAEYTSSDEGAYGCIFIDPGYRWMSRGGNSINNPLMISDKTVVLAVVTIKPMDYSTPPTRRLLSMNSDGSDMRLHSLSTFGMGENRLRTVAPGHTTVGVHAPLSNRIEIVSPQEIQTELALQYANSRLENPPVFSAKAMKTRLQAAFDAEHHTKIHVKTLGNTALSRRLLESNGISDSSGNRFQNQSASQCLVAENDFVCRECNTAFMYGYDEAEYWRMMTMKVDRGENVPMEVFRHNMARILHHHAATMVRDAVEGRPVQFTTHAPTHGRALLEVTAHDGLSTTVDVEAMFRMDKGVGVLFLDMFRCIIAATAQAPVNISIVDMNETVTVCASNVNASNEVTKVQEALLTECGAGTTKLSEEICSKFYQTFIMTAPSIAFDWFDIIENAKSPFLWFKFHTSTGIYPDDDAVIIYNIRKLIAETIGAAMNKVLVEVREKDVLATDLLKISRRLLATSPRDMVVFVWVYSSDGNTVGDVVWPAGRSVDVEIASYADTYRTAITTALMATFLKEVVLDDVANDGVMTHPFQPTLDEYSVTFVIDYDVIANVTDAVKVVTMVAVTKAVLAGGLAIKETDIRVLSLKHANSTNSTYTAISFEIRVADIDKMRTLATEIELKSSILTNVATERLRMSGSFETVESISLRSGSLKGTDHTRSVSVSGGAGMLIILIIFGVCAVVGCIYVGIMTYLGKPIFFCCGPPGRSETPIAAAASPPATRQIMYEHVPHMEATLAHFYQSQHPAYDRRYM